MTDFPGLVRLPREASVAARLQSIRRELFGDHGGTELARRVGVPWRAWASYERGVTVPGEVILSFLEVTGAEPTWLLRGEGPMYGPRPRRDVPREPPPRV